MHSTYTNSYIVQGIMGHIDQRRDILMAVQLNRVDVGY